MTPAEFRSIRHSLSLTQLALAERIRVTRRAVLYWESGDKPIPGPVAVLMGMLRGAS